jgi:thiaminase
MLWHLIKVLTAYRPNKLSKRIKLETKTLHDEIETHLFFKKMIDGSLSNEHYYVYLFNLLPI